MSQSVVREPPVFTVQNVHLSSVGVERTLAAGSQQLDCLLLAFARKLLNDLTVVNGSVADFKLRPHVLQLGAPFDEDVSSCAPQ